MSLRLRKENLRLGEVEIRYKVEMVEFEIGGG